MSMFNIVTTRDGTIIGVIREIDNAHIPADPANADWQAYQAWLKARLEPVDPSPPNQQA